MLPRLMEANKLNSLHLGHLIVYLAEHLDARRRRIFNFNLLYDRHCDRLSGVV